MDEPVPYDVIIDRISHEVPYYRTYLKNAVLAGRHGGQQSVHVDGRRQVLRGRPWPPGSGVAQPPHGGCCPTRRTSPGIVPEESLRNLVYPLDWQGDRGPRRDALHPQGRPRRRLEGGLRLPLAGRADPSLRPLGLLTMIVQEFIEWEQFVRCICIGQEDVLPIKYDPRARKYLRASTTTWPRSWASASCGTPLTLCPRPGLRHELPGVRRAGRRALRHRLHEPGPGHGHLLAHAALLRVGGETMADLAIRLAPKRRASRSAEAQVERLFTAGGVGSAAQAL